jgi:hypothetical protein
MSYELHLIRHGALDDWDHPMGRELNPGPLEPLKE